MGRKVWVPTVSGPLAPCAAGFESWLKSRAYSPSAVADRLYQFDQLSRWLEREGLAVGELTGRAGRAVRRCAAGGGLGDVGLPAERAAAARVPAGAGGRPGAGAGARAGTAVRSCSRITAAICRSSAGSQITRCSMRMNRPRGCSWRAGRARTGWTAAVGRGGRELVPGARVPEAQRVGSAEISCARCGRFCATCTWLA